MSAARVPGTANVAANGAPLPGVPAGRARRVSRMNWTTRHAHPSVKMIHAAMKAGPKRMPYRSSAGAAPEDRALASDAAEVASMPPPVGALVASGETPGAETSAVSADAAAASCACAGHALRSRMRAAMNNTIAGNRNVTIGLRASRCGWDDQCLIYHNSTDTTTLPVSRFRDLLDLAEVILYR